MSERWLRGTLEGHYVGTAAQKPMTSAHGTGQRYRVRIFRAFIRDVTVFEPEGESAEPSEAAEPTEPAGKLPVELGPDCFYQAKIDDARFFGVQPRVTLQGPIYDVAVESFRITDSTTHQGRSYGRVEGIIYGRFRLPPTRESTSAEPVAVASGPKIPEPEEENVGAPSKKGGEGAVSPQRGDPTTADHPAPGDGSTRSDHPRARHTTADPSDGSDDKTSGEQDPEEPLRKSTPESEPTLVRVPFVLLTVGVAIALGLMGGTLPALLWLGLWIPIGMVRMVINGQFPVTNTQRVMGATLVAVQLICLSMLFLHWWDAGCKSEDVWPLVGVFATVIAAALIPWPVALFSTQIGMALALLALVSPVGTRCVDPSAANNASAAEQKPKPSAAHPISPRTNQDGSWPRRRSTER